MVLNLLWYICCPTMQPNHVASCRHIKYNNSTTPGIYSLRLQSLGTSEGMFIATQCLGGEIVEYLPNSVAAKFEATGSCS
jgi:hypothetical protein